MSISAPAGTHVCRRARRRLRVSTSDLRFAHKGGFLMGMSTQEMLLAEIKKQPEPVLREVWHYMKYLTRQREEEVWADMLATRQVEQEVLDILDAHESAAR